MTLIIRDTWNHDGSDKGPPIRFPQSPNGYQSLTEMQAEGKRRFAYRGRFYLIPNGYVVSEDLYTQVVTLE